MLDDAGHLAGADVPTTIEDRKASARAWFETLRDRLCAAFERAGGRGCPPDPPSPTGRRGGSRARHGSAPTTAARPAAAA